MSEYYDIPFVPSSEERLATMVKLANISPRCRTIDLGSGDAQVVIAMANQGAQSYGIEIDPLRFQQSCDNIIAHKLLGKAFIIQGSMWDSDLHSFDIITIYGITGMMAKLEVKLRQETKPGAKFISNGFMLPHWSPTYSENSVHLYIK